MLHSLRKIIQAVSAAEDLQSALKLVVHQVRRAMRTDVCSIYLYFPQTDNYVLMASEGLNQASIGLASLASGKGLVGLVGFKAETINLKRAAEHPNFHYVQETGEEAFSSFLGVPIIHHRKVLGILILAYRLFLMKILFREVFLVDLKVHPIMHLHLLLLKLYLLR
jgi:phosphotransferase system enzyme I (PtsP)